VPSRRPPTLDHPAWESISAGDPVRVAALRVAWFAREHGRPVDEAIVKAFDDLMAEAGAG
jgi:hypothetical protein